MEYLSFDDVRRKRESIRQAFDDLMATKSLVVRPRANQWRFFRGCVQCLLQLDAEEAREFADLSSVPAAQYKFEVERKLRIFYQSPGARKDYVFAMMHKSRLHWFGFFETDYPDLAGYVVLVRDMAENDGAVVIMRRELVEYLESVVARGMEAELQAYLALPEMRLDVLDPWFQRDSPAWRRIADVVAGCRRRGWCLQNPMNPSTCQLLKVQVTKLEEAGAVVATREYWYLRWWDRRKNKYVYIYHETNQQYYHLRKHDSRWRIHENIRPQPRSSQPLRWKRN